ncbi:metallophosphoesterase family protein [Planococcus lenghuensis]|uniref:Phosphoesterase n=1 Tax=Planococcus lenghuensis TaxID=2213202 RepID=A0A1Q2KUK4_9BACL|nr:metallophosphoesterase [Planococcus lenghuensis]AQQ51869.1 YfcE family phosphodiesterase [Planococcus lenghuensis]
MKVVILSDTHIPMRAKKLPHALTVMLQDADFIVHAGDWQQLDVYHELAAYAETDGVAGNVDPWEIADKFGRKKVLTFAQVRVGVIHGDGTQKTTEQRALDAFADDEVDIIVFGHSHIPLMRKEKDVLLFNPGSPTDKRRQPHYSFGVLEIGDTWELKHVYFDEKD